MDTYKYKKFIIYLSAWLTYALFVFYSFGTISITAFLFSIALCILAAWLYGYFGCIITTILCIPFHYIVLTYFSDDLSMWKEALNPFGISAQLAVSGSIATLRHTKQKIDKLNTNLESIVKKRTEELKRLQRYIIQNQETSQVMLSHLLLDDIGESLVRIKYKCDLLTDKLMQDDNPALIRVGKLSEMVKNSIDVVQNLEFVDRYNLDKEINFADAIKEVAGHFEETTGVRFEFNLRTNLEVIPQRIQHQLYRCTQEAITNAVRHAKATCIVINLGLELDSYRLEIINDGQSMPAKIESGLGLNLMRHRIHQLGGNLNLGTAADGRTEVACTIPQV